LKTYEKQLELFEKITNEKILAISAGQAKKYAIAVTRKSFSYIFSKETDVMHNNLHQILTFSNTENLK